MLNRGIYQKATFPEEPVYIAKVCKKVSSLILNPDFQAYPQNVSDSSRLIKACLIILQSTWKRKSMLVSTEYIGAWSILPCLFEFFKQ